MVGTFVWAMKQHSLGMNFFIEANLWQSDEKKDLLSHIINNVIFSQNPELVTQKMTYFFQLITYYFNKMKNFLKITRSLFEIA